MARLKIELNNPQIVRDILQNAYDLANEQVIQAQNEINKLVNSTNLQEEVMDSKAKLSKAINDYMNIKDKAISKKMEIAKLMTEIINHGGTLEESNANANTRQTFDLSKIREAVKNMHNETETKTIELKK